MKASTALRSLSRRRLVPVKIFYVAVDVGIPYYRGASVHVHQSSKHLTEYGYEVHVLCRRYSRQQQEHEVIDGFHVHRIYRGILGPVPFSSYKGKRHSFSKMGALRTFGKAAYRLYLRSVYSLYAAIHAIKIIQNYDLDVILERETSFGCGTLASIITGRPLVLEINGPEFSVLSVKHAKKIVAYPRLKKRLLQMGVPKDRILELFAAVDSNLFRPDSKLGARIKKKLGLGKAPVVGYVGIFAPWHGTETLYKASKIVLESMPETVFLMVGPYAQDSVKRVRKLGIENSFLFVGPVDHKLIPGYINASNVMVAPFDPSKSSLTKYLDFTFFPFKILEYMSCGKPLVSTNCGMIPEIVHDGSSAFLIEPGDENALAGAILNLLRNPRLAEEMGRRAREAMMNKYSWENYSAYLTNIFKEILARSDLS